MFLRSVCIFMLALVTAVPSAVAGDNESSANYSVKWMFKTNGAIRSTVTLANGLLLFGSADSYLYAIDKSGREKWKFKSGGAVNSKPAFSAGTAYFTSRDHFMYAVNTVTGKLKWKYRLGNQLVPHKWGWEYFLSSPVTDGGMVYAGGGDGIIYALDKETGKLRWSYKTGGRVRTTPAVNKHILYCGSFDGHMYALDKASGRLIWKFETDGTQFNSDSSGWDRRSLDSSPAFSDDLVVFGSRDGNVYALDANTGQKKWAFTYGPTWAISSPAIAGNTVYIGWSDNFLFSAIDLHTGKEKWKYKAGYYVYSSPMVADNKVFVGSHDGNLYCFDKDNGSKLWQYHTNGAVYSSPVMDNETIYVGSDDGHLYAFRKQQGAPLMKAVFAPRDPVYQSWLTDQRLPAYLGINGFNMEDSSTAATFMQDRIADERPSVLVMASCLLTTQMMMKDQRGKMLITRYMEAGGRIVWLGNLPNMNQYDTSGRFLGEDPAVAKIMLDMDFDIFHDGGEYHCTVTAEGKKWGLPDWYVGSFSVKQQPGITPLAINEYGRPAAWIKKIGSKGGMFIQARLWPNDKGMKDAHLELIKRIAEYRPDDAVNDKKLSGTGSGK